MSDIRSVIDLADFIGFEAIDAEIGVWIETGAYDEPISEHINDGHLDKFVELRAIELGFKPPYAYPAPDEQKLF